MTASPSSGPAKRPRRHPSRPRQAGAAPLSAQDQDKIEQVIDGLHASEMKLHALELSSESSQRGPGLDPQFKLIQDSAQQLFTVAHIDAPHAGLREAATLFSACAADCLGHNAHESKTGASLALACLALGADVPLSLQGADLANFPLLLRHWEHLGQAAKERVLRNAAAWLSPEELDEQVADLALRRRCPHAVQLMLDLGLGQLDDTQWLIHLVLKGQEIDHEERLDLLVMPRRLQPIVRGLVQRWSFEWGEDPGAPDLGQQAPDQLRVLAHQLCWRDPEADQPRRRASASRLGDRDLDLVRQAARWNTSVLLTALADDPRPGLSLLVADSDEAALNLAEWIWDKVPGAPLGQGQAAEPYRRYFSEDEEANLMQGEDFGVSLRRQLNTVTPLCHVSLGPQGARHAAIVCARLLQLIHARQPLMSLQALGSAAPLLLFGTSSNHRVFDTVTSHTGSTCRRTEPDLIRGSWQAIEALWDEARAQHTAQARGEMGHAPGAPDLGGLWPYLALYIRQVPFNSHEPSEMGAMRAQPRTGVITACAEALGRRARMVPHMPEVSEGQREERGELLRQLWSGGLLAAMSCPVEGGATAWEAPGYLDAWIKWGAEYEERMRAVNRAFNARNAH